jgi:hypothetical protein
VAYNVHATDIKIRQGLKIPTFENRMTTFFSAAVSTAGEMDLKDVGTTDVKKF